MFVLNVGRGKVESLAFGPDSRALAVVGAERGLLLWRDPLDGSEPRALCLPEESPAGPVRFSAGGRRIEWRGHNLLAVFDAASGERVALLQCPVPGSVNFTAALVADGASVLVSRMVASEGREFRSQLERVALSGPQFAAAGWSVTFPGVVWDDSLFLPDGRTAVVLVIRRKKQSQWQSLLMGRDLTTGRELWSSLPADDAPRFPTLSMDGRMVAAWAATFLTAWRTDDLQRAPVRTRNDGKKHFTGIAFHPSGRYLAATSNDATVKLYDTQTWKVAQAFAWGTGRARSVAFSPDGCRAAVGSDKGQVLIWDVDV